MQPTVPALVPAVPTGPGGGGVGVGVETLDDVGWLADAPVMLEWRCCTVAEDAGAPLLKSPVDVARCCQMICRGRGRGWGERWWKRREK